MLTVVLTILKWIGITILVLLGILIFLLCLVLFVPIRYNADGFYKDSYRVRARISWLLHIVSFSLDYEKEQPFHMKLRVFGIPIFDNLKKKDKIPKKTKVQKNPVKEQTSPEIIAASVEKKHSSVKQQQTVESQNEVIEADESVVDVEEALNTDETLDENISDEIEKLGFVEKIKLLFSKVIGAFRNIKYTIHRICDTIKGIKDNITYFVELFKKDSTKAALAACKKQLMRIFKNLKPKKFQVNLHIGMEDPATMGDILGVWGMLYPIHQGHIDICPDFEQAVLEGEFYCKGRITVYIYIWTVIIILFDKDIRRLRKCLVQKG